MRPPTPPSATHRAPRTSEPGYAGPTPPPAHSRGTRVVSSAWGESGLPFPRTLPPVNQEDPRPSRPRSGISCLCFETGFPRAALAVLEPAV